MDRRILALAVVTAGLYAVTLGYPYVYEDRNDLEAFRRPWPLYSEDIIMDAQRTPTRLLRDVSFVLSGTTPFGAHAGNVVLHLVNGGLVYVLALGLMSQSGAVFAAGVYWLHPVQLESVAYISSRADLVGLLFVLLALLARRHVWLSALCACLAVAAKETYAIALVIPLLAAPLSWRTVGMAAGGAWIASGLWHSFGRWPSVLESLQTLGQLTTLLTLWVWPVGLTVDHDWIGMTSQTLVASVAVWSMALSVAWLCRWPQWSVMAGLVLAIYLPRLGVPMGEGLHEHHLLAASVPISLYLGSWVGGPHA